MKLKPIQQISAAGLSLLLLLAGCSASGEQAISPMASADAGQSSTPGGAATPGGGEPSPSPSAAASVKPTDQPNAKPTVDSTGKPTIESTAKPTSEPSAKPTAKPTVKPTAKPTVKPTAKPSAASGDDGITVIAEPAALDVIVNKQRRLPADYVPADLTEPQVRFPYTEKLEKRKLRKVAANALTEMFQAAEQDGIILYAVSGYRSYQTQKSLYDNYVKRDGEEAASRYSAKPGTSEHQTGLTMDLSSKSNNYQLTQAFGDTKEGKWLAKHSWEYGFIIRYQQETESITGYMYEPWHVRYIGEPTAKDVFDQSVTLEEYYDFAVPVAG